MSNLIKSKKVSLGLPVEIAGSYLMEREVIRKKEIRPQTEEVLVNTKEQKQAIEAFYLDEKEKIFEQYKTEAQKKAKEIFEAEVKKAYETGVEQARIEAKKILAEAEVEAQNNINDFADLKEKLLNDYKEEIYSLEPEIISFIMEITAKIIGKETEQGEYIDFLVKDTIEHLVTKKDAVLKLSANDYSTVIANMKELITRIDGFGEIKVVQDDSLKPGSCIVETPYGIVDGGIKTRIEKIKKEIEELTVKRGEKRGA